MEKDIAEIRQEGKRLGTKIGFMNEANLALTQGVLPGARHSMASRTLHLILTTL